MQNPQDYLKEWFVRFLENKDIYFKQIQEISYNAGIVRVVTKGKEIYYQIVPFPKSIVEGVGKITGEHKGLVLYNTEENFKILIKEWGKLTKEKSLMIYFVNPFSKTDKKWVISPRTHQLISDEESLVDGLNSLFLMVDTITEKEIKNILQ